MLRSMLSGMGSNASPYYHFYEMAHTMVAPMRAMADATRLYYKNPMNPLTHTQFGKQMAAACEVFERTTRRYGKPIFGLDTTVVDGQTVEITEHVVWERPFCKLIHFSRDNVVFNPRQPKLLIVAPMSGHYATLLRGTVEEFLPDHEVYITDWEDARMVPMAAGSFNLDDYIDYVIAMLNHLGPRTHVMAVCQPSVPVFAAVARMEEMNDPCAPSTMTLMGGPIDTRSNPTAVNKLAQTRGVEWFKRNVITRVPFPNPGMMREVYPGFMQLTGFMTMNLDRHVNAHRDLFANLVRGDGESTEKHVEFYDEYLAVMDLTAEFYLQTIRTVFVEHHLPLGTMTHHGDPVDPGKIWRTGLLTVEGEKDDITGGGQTEAAHRLAHNIPAERAVHYLQPDVGHYGVFNGSRFRAEIAPRVRKFIRDNNRPVADLSRSAAKLAAAPAAKALPKQAPAKV